MRRFTYMRPIASLVVATLTLAVAPPAAGSPTITEFPVPTANSRPFGITAGPDGALWFTEWMGNRIGRITTDGAFTEYRVPTPGSQPMGITVGPDGALWFTERLGDKIGRITTDGAITEFPIPPPPTQPRRSEARGITTGPDGALWFAASESHKIGRITTAGAITQFLLPPLSRDPMWITAGPDGALWFTVNIDSKIGRITTDGSISEFPLPLSGSLPFGITTGPDGALWFTEGSSFHNKIGRITTAGAITEFVVPTPQIIPSGITTGPDGALWFTGRNGRVGRVTTGGAIADYPVPVPYSSTPEQITAGPDGALWFTESGANMIARLTVPPHPTETEVSCTPRTVMAEAMTTCVASVSDAEVETATTPAGLVDFTGSGAGQFEGSASCTLTETRPGVATCQVAYMPAATSANAVRNDQITATYAGDAKHANSNGSTEVTVLSIELLRQGAFVIGDQDATLDATVTFWGARWQKLNSTSSGSAAPSFAGYAGSTDTNPPDCGDRWTTLPGASSEPPATVPRLMAVIASSSIRKAGSSISGDIPKVVVVETDPGYGPEPGNAGTGTVVGTICAG